MTDGPRPPPEVVAAGAMPGGLDVLGDWYEDRGQVFWAQWFRVALTPDDRRALLLDQLTTVLPRAAFQRLGPTSLRVLQAPLGEPFWTELVWTVHDASRLPDVLAWPPLLPGPRAIHLRRGRTLSQQGDHGRAVMVELAHALLRQWPDVEALEIGDDMPIELIQAARSLEVISGGVTAPTLGDLRVSTLRLHHATSARMRAHAELHMPRLERLELVGGNPYTSADWRSALGRLVGDRKIQVIETSHPEYAVEALQRVSRSDVQVERESADDLRDRRDYWSLAL